MNESGVWWSFGWFAVILVVAALAALVLLQPLLQELAPVMAVLGHKG